MTVGPVERSIIALSGLLQLGAVSSNKALPPPIPFGLGADEHFRLALEAQQHPTPFEEFGIVDKGLQFAADELGRHGLKLRAMRIKWVQELGRRWQPVSARLRKAQARGPRAATRQTLGTDCTADASGGMARPWVPCMSAGRILSCGLFRAA